jgi:tetratricopeptide (TPR) repeat protein
MAPTRPKNRNKKGQKKKPPSLDLVLQEATAILHGGDPQKAFQVTKKVFERTGAGGDFELQALNLLGLICIELGETDDARSYLLRAAEIDQDGSMDEKVGGGPEKFLWLAQISEEGGPDSVRWFEKGAAALRTQIDNLSQRKPNRTAQDGQGLTVLEEKRRELAGVLCAVAEVYMTDLSWEADAEQRCEAFVTEATMTCPDSAETWQTVANVRISQQRTDDARTALKRSLEIWQDLPPEDVRVPDFAARVSLARLLMEVDMTTEAMKVLERLVTNDDTSVEAWYLGGWCRFIQGDKGRESSSGSNGTGTDKASEEPGWRAAWAASQQWLVQCLKLYKTQEYEDERLGEHALELVQIINKELGELPADEEEDGDEWEDEDDEDDEDEDMAA